MREAGKEKEDGEGKEERRRKTYFIHHAPQLRPHQARQDVLQEGQVDVCLDDLELRVARVQGERSGRGFARFDGAGEEVEREELHVFFAFLSFFSFSFSLFFKALSFGAIVGRKRRS